MDSSAFSFLGEKFEIQTELDLAKGIVRDRAEVKTKSGNKNKVSIRFQIWVFPNNKGVKIYAPLWKYRLNALTEA